jgi:O-antigen/teichoic acid export membrane protein
MEPEITDQPQGPGVRSVTSGGVVVRNLLFAAGAQVWSVILLAVSVPIVVHGLGDSAYGIFVLTSLLLGYVGLLDLGLTPAVVRSLAIHYASGSNQDLSRIVGTALTLLLGVGIIGGLIIGLLAGPAVTSMLHVPASLQPDAIFVLRLTALGFAINMVLTVFGAIPQGLQRLELFTVRSIIFITATTVAQILAVKLGGGLRWVAGVTIAINVVSLLVFVVVARRLLPEVRFWPGFNRWALRELGSFGAMRFINQVSGQLIFQVDRLIVAAFLPIRAVTFYAVPLNITQKFSAVQFIFSGAFFPAASELHGLKDTDRLRRLYLASMKLQLVLVLPLAILVAGFARPLLGSWVGQSFAVNSTAVLIILAVAYGVANVIGVPGLASDATGHAHWTAAFAVVSAVINVTLTLILVPRLGPIGAAYALLVTGLTNGMVFVQVVQARFLHISLLTVVRKAVIRPAAAGLVLLAYSLLLAPHLHRLRWVIGAFLLGGLLYLGCTVLFGVWDEAEKALARTTLAQALKRNRVR